MISRRYWHGLAAALLLVLSPASRAQSPVTCEDAGAAAEKAFNLPQGLLRAIGQVESGRWDATRGRAVPWPWSIDVAGQGRQFASKPEALLATRAALDAGTRNVDVGCFQINLLHHPTAFADLDQALDPTANALYAARFLTALRERLGSWDGAVAAYHSADPARGGWYRQLVYANWTGDGTPGSYPPALPPTGIRIWTPGPIGSAPGMIVLDGASRSPAHPLPRIITPGG